MIEMHSTISKRKNLKKINGIFIARKGMMKVIPDSKEENYERQYLQSH